MTLVIRVPPGQVEATKLQLAREFERANADGASPSVAFDDEVDPNAVDKPALILRVVPTRWTSAKVHAADLITALAAPMGFAISQIPKNKRMIIASVLLGAFMLDGTRRWLDRSAAMEAAASNYMPNTFQADVLREASRKR